MEAGYFDGSIPTDIAAPPGLSPKRAELARFLEWRRRTENEIEVLEEAHHRAIEALGGEATTKRKIDALIEADVNEVLRFALDGQQITAKKLRAFERKQLEQKLKDDKHAAQVASKTLGQIEHQIDVKKIGLDFLDSRTERFVKSAVVEAARESDLGERYLQKIGELRDVWLQLVGLRVWWESMTASPPVQCMVCPESKYLVLVCQPSPAKIANLRHPASFRKGRCSLAGTRNSTC